MGSGELVSASDNQFSRERLLIQLRESRTAGDATAWRTDVTQGWFTSCSEKWVPKKSGLHPRAVRKSRVHPR